MSPRRAWRDSDRRSFADGDILRASTIDGRRPIPPAVEEWLDETDQLGDESIAYGSVTVELDGDGAIAHLDRLGATDGLLDDLAELLGIEAGRLNIVITIARN